MPSESEQMEGMTNSGGHSPKSSLYIVGIGPGPAVLRTKAACSAIRSAEYVVGYKPYLDLISDLLPGKAVYSSGMGREVERVRAAVDLMDRGPVALVSSGDANVYGMAGLGLEMAARPEEVQIVPGVTSFTAAACRAGLSFRECVAVISLSNLLTPWPEIEARLRLAAETQMPVALYNPRSRKRDWQLLRALELLGSRDVLIAKNVGREAEEIFWSTTGRLVEEEALRERIDMNTLLILSGRGAFLGAASRQAGVNLVGIGPGHIEHLTLEAEMTLQSSQKVFGPARYLDLMEQAISSHRVVHSGPCPERMAARLAGAAAVARAEAGPAYSLGETPAFSVPAGGSWSRPGRLGRPGKPCPCTSAPASALSPPWRPGRERRS